MVLTCSNPPRLQLWIGRCKNQERHRKTQYKKHKTTQNEMNAYFNNWLKFLLIKMTSLYQTVPSILQQLVALPVFFSAQPSVLLWYALLHYRLLVYLPCAAPLCLRQNNHHVPAVLEVPVLIGTSYSWLKPGS